MEHVKKSFLDQINPRNYTITTKIISLILILTLLVIVFYSWVGLRALRVSVIENTGEHLEHISYIKASELNLSLQDKEDQILKLARSSELRRASMDFISAFSSIDSEHSSLLYGGKKNEIKNQLRNYYENDVREHSPLSADKVDLYFPTDDRTLIAQHIYLAKNSKNYDEKIKMTQADDQSTYATYHQRHHPNLVSALNKLDAKDIYIIDPNTGYVVYSAQKNIDFGIDLNKGANRNSKLAEALHTAMAAEQMGIVLSNYSNYLPASGQPLLFASIPVYYHDRFISVVVVTFGTDLFDDRLVQDYMMAGNSSLKYAVISSNLKLCNNPKEFIINKDIYTKKLLKNAKKSEVEDIMKHVSLNNLALYTEYPFESKDDILSEGISNASDYTQTPVIASTIKLNFKNLPLLLVTQIDQSEVTKAFIQQGWRHILLAIIILAIIFLLIWNLSKNFSTRLLQLLESIQLLQKGEKAPQLTNSSNDELGHAIDAYNAMRQRILNAEEFALEMSEGNYKYPFEILSDKDSLGKSLNTLKDKLIKSKEEQDERSREDEIRNWTNSGIAKFNDLLRSNNDNIQKLAYVIIENLVEYIAANVGGIYMVEGDDQGEKRIELLSAFAFDRRKYINQSFATNEGLLGACYMEKKPIFLKKIPEDYIEISSGLGGQIPSCLYLVPLKVDEEVLGIIEVASFEVLDQHKLDLINQLADSIAATFIGVRLNMKTASLLEESNRRAEEITQQEEEMRQNLEEMQATQEELARLRQDDERKSDEMQLRIENTRNTLKALLDAIPGGYSLKDQNGVIHLINTEGAVYYGSTIDRATGKTDHELLSAKLAEAEHQRDIDTLEDGLQEYPEEVEVDGTSKKYQVTKKPFMMPELGQNGILTIRTEIKG